MDFLEEWEAFPSTNATRDLIDAFSYMGQIAFPPPAEDQDDTVRWT